MSDFEDTISGLTPSRQASIKAKVAELVVEIGNNVKPPVKSIVDYIATFGSLNTPEDVARYGIYTARQTGRSNALLMAIQNEPCYLLVHRLDYGKELLETLKVMRPDYDIKNITVISPANMDTATRGKSWRPTYVDNAVLDILQLDYIQHLNRKF